MEQGKELVSEAVELAAAAARPTAADAATEDRRSQPDGVARARRPDPDLARPTPVCKVAFHRRGVEQLGSSLGS